jgi:hypothetical protein
MRPLVMYIWSQERLAGNAGPQPRLRRPQSRKRRLHRLTHVVAVLRTARLR